MSNLAAPAPELEPQSKTALSRPSRSQLALAEMGSEIAAFEALLAGNEAVSDEVFLTLTKKLAAYVQIISPVDEEDMDMNSIARKRREPLVETVNKRLYAARRSSFSRRFAQTYGDISALSPAERNLALELNADVIRELASEGAVLGLREEVRIRLLELSTSALAGREVDPRISNANRPLVPDVRLV